jgi:hypothetical protein
VGNTEIYKLGFLEAYQKVGEIIDMDERRFRTIEAQTLALYTIFGNGVLDDDPSNPSWRIQNVPGDETGQIVQITPGSGHVAWKSAVTTSVNQVRLPPPTGLTTGNTYTFWIYARANDTTHDRRTVDFVASTIEIVDLDNYIGLGAVVVNYSTTPPTVTCYNDAEHGRVNISLFSTLASLINTHKHIGGANNPSRVDLGLHVQGKLDGSFVENIDLNTVTSGNLSPDRLPLISHTVLSDIGTLTHPEIDSLLESIQNPDEYRLSDLHIANMLQLALALKKQSGLSTIDEKLINAIFYSPGYNANDKLVSYYSTFASYGLSGVVADFVPGPTGAGKVDLAIIDKNIHQIYGTNPASINSDVIVWTTDLDFSTALNNHKTRVDSPEPYPHDIVVSGSGIDGEINVDIPLNYKSITSTNLGDSVSSFDWDGGYKFIDNKTEGSIQPPPPLWVLVPPYNNEFIDNYSVERYYYGLFDFAQDWSERTKIGIGWGLTSDSMPGDVYVYLIYDDGSPIEIVKNGVLTTINISSLVTLRDGDLQTSTTRMYRSINLSEFNITDMSEIKGIGVAWKTANGWDGQEVGFYLLYPNDDEISTDASPNLAVVEERQILPDTTSAIFIWNDSLYAETAEIVFRFDSGYDTTTYSILNWDTVTPSGTQIRFRTRAGNDDASMGVYYDVDVDTHLINSLSSVGRYLDIHVKLISAAGLQSAPTLETLSLAFEGTGAPAVKTWNKSTTDLSTSQTGWLEGRKFVNISVGEDYTDGPLTKNSLVLTTDSGVGEFQYIRNDNSYSSFDFYGSDESSYQNGENLYTTPVQAWNGSIRAGFENPLDFQILSDKSVVFADTDNDRIVHLDLNGNFIKAIQGNIRLRNIDRDFVALTANYNPELGKLWITFSQNITIADKSKIYLQSDQNSISFGLSDVNAVPFAPVDNKSATIQVSFSSSVTELINSWTSPMKILILNGAVTSDGSSSTGGGNASDGGGTDSGGGGNESNDDCLPSGLYENLGAGELTGELSCATGLLNTDVLIDSGDFNNDGEITNTLQGPGGQTENITLNVFSGDVVFYNLFNPISIQVLEESNSWLVATAGTESVIKFDSTSSVSWSIPSSLITMREGYGGSAYLLSNGNVLVAAPASDEDGAKGSLMLINRTSGNTPLFSIPINGDAVKALPYTNSMEFWVVINDRSAEGSLSRLVRINTSAKITWSWGDGLLTHPTGMSVLENGTLLVSE